MATEKTPTQKRMVRAENSAKEWKMKAIKRREELEALKCQLKTSHEGASIKNIALDDSAKRCAELEKQLKTATIQLEKANKIIMKQQADLDEFKKKAFR